MEGKSLVAILAVVTVCLALMNISVGFLKYKQMTGFATSQIAQVNITVNSAVNINMSRFNASWGQGQINDTGVNQYNASLYTHRESASVERGNWSYDTVKGFVLVNVGNVNTTVKISSNVNESFLFGIAPADANREFKINVTNKDAGACKFNASFVTATWYTPNLTSLSWPCYICDQFGYLDGQDEIYIDHLLTVPYDANTTNTELIATLTATAAAAA